MGCGLVTSPQKTETSLAQQYICASVSLAQGVKVTRRYFEIYFYRVALHIVLVHVKKDVGAVLYGSRDS